MVSRHNFRLLTIIKSTIGYEFDSTFLHPLFDFQEGLDDYRKISAFPYNEFFWENHDEIQLNYADSSNDRFFHDSTTLTNVKFFGNKRHKLQFEHPFIQWSSNRILKRDMVSDTISDKVLKYLNFISTQSRLQDLCKS